MDDETRAAFAEARAETQAAFAEARAETQAALAEARAETQAAFAEARAGNQAAFARIDRYFELNQLQITELRRDVNANGEALAALSSEVRSLRSWTEAGFVRIRDELRSFRASVEDRLAQLGIRVERLQRRLDDMRV